MAPGIDKQRPQGPHDQSRRHISSYPENTIGCGNREVGKRMFKDTEPYVMLRRFTHDSYEIRRIPFAKSAGIPGKSRETNTSCMERISSTLCIHERVDGTGGNFVYMDRQTVPITLENVLGVHRLLTYIWKDGGALRNTRDSCFRRWKGYGQRRWNHIWILR